MPTTVVLFTRDLRVHDNPVLARAAARGRVVPLFVLDDGILGSPYAAPNRVAFLRESLADLDQGLRQLGGRLVLRRGDVAEEVADVVRATGADEVHVAADVTGYARRRARVVGSVVAGLGCRLVVGPGHTIVPAGGVAPEGRDHYRVFTPYWRAWAAASVRDVVDVPRQVVVPDVPGTALPRLEELVAGTPSPARQPGGEAAARARLAELLAGGASRYDDARDDLVDGATGLSAHLHFGTLSAVEVAASLDPHLDDGQAALHRQLAWRDFNHQLLAANPDLARVDLRPRGDRWRDDPQALRAWQQGRTGFPLVDAGMRQLMATGYLHNRVRMVAASLLTKTLRIDWRHGFAWFQHWLTDATVAQNAANWQWVAGTGTDTRPNRVHNPQRQRERFDPDGRYVRRWLPEFTDGRLDLGGDVPHPAALAVAPASARDGYPAPLVDLDEARRAFLAERGAA